MSYLFFKYIYYITGILAVVYAFITFMAIREYINKKDDMKKLTERCVSCVAEIINPVVSMRTSKIEGTVIYNEVEYFVDGVKINSVVYIIEPMRIFKKGDMIDIYYDPENPCHAFDKDMKDILIGKPFRQCIMYAVIAVIMLLCTIFGFLSGENLLDIMYDIIV